MHKKNILSTRLYVYLTFFCLGFVSCRSPKELTYFNDAGSREQLNGVPGAMPQYKIRKKDNLFISIISSNAELNKVYNPVQTGKNTNDDNRYSTLAEQSVNGTEVDVMGFIELPVLGKISLEGKTLSESKDEIEKRAKSFIKDAVVKVKLLSFKVTVLGEVKTPGVYNTYTDNFNVIDAIGLANGNTDYAELGKIMVLRPTESGSTTYVLDLKSKKALSSEAYWLQPNDKVFLPPATSKNSQLRISTTALVLSTVTSVFLILNYIKK